jgi:hypothetical protein
MTWATLRAAEVAEELAEAATLDTDENSANSVARSDPESQALYRAWAG